jgi:hypothetical protein
MQSWFATIDWTARGRRQNEASRVSDKGNIFYVLNGCWLSLQLLIWLSVTMLILTQTYDNGIRSFIIIFMIMTTRKFGWFSLMTILQTNCCFVCLLCYTKILYYSYFLILGS